jgi:succinate dehydrogenase hydrophobic anchor subunit
VAVHPVVVGTVTQPTAVAAGERTRGWVLTRVTALFLAVLLPLQVAVVVVQGDVGRTTFATVSERFSGPWWPALEWITLVLALVHGALVLRVRLARRFPARATLAGAAVAAAAVALGLGATWGILTFA